MTDRNTDTAKEEKTLWVDGGITEVSAGGNRIGDYTVNKNIENEIETFRFHTMGIPPSRKRDPDEIKLEILEEKTENITLWLSRFGRAVYAVTGIVQIVAAVAGFKVLWGWNVFFAVTGAVLTGWLPIIGTVVGIAGAIKGWGWSPLPTLLLFCWPFVFFAAVILFKAAALSLLAGKKRRS